MPVGVLCVGGMVVRARAITLMGGQTGYARAKCTCARTHGLFTYCGGEGEDKCVWGG